MRTKRYWIFLVALVLTASACTEKITTDLTQTAFIPKPVKVTATGDAFRIKEGTTIWVDDNNDDLKMVASFFKNALQRTGTPEIKIATTDKTPSKGIYLTVNNTENIAAEGYEAQITPKLLTLNGADAAGCFFGIQTLLQALPVKAEAGQSIFIPTGSISDSPEFGYRGAMLDVARHFFNVEEVKQFIDFLAMFKMNRLHLHLSDDQGWRIEIKSWPKLTQVGGKTEVGGGVGGFYTQEQYAELVQYAKERYITVVPEIDMPGHTNAALSSYPELNCDGKARNAYTGTEVGFSTLCTSKEITYQFIDDVVGEIAALTPGSYFHIGGDESHVTPMKDYIPFINRVQEIVRKHGKKVIGWDEIANADLVDNAIVQFWADEKNTTMGVEKGARVLMSPAARAYLDMQYDSTTHLGLHWAGYIEIEHGYNWDPASLLESVSKENIVGIEAPLWSETVTNIDEVEYMVFPRLPGYAEIGWTAPSQRNWNEYKQRLAEYGKRFEALGIDFYASEQVPWNE